VNALRQAGLGGHAHQLDKGHAWFSTLSPGEQQRLHFARVFLQRPDWVFLDESTSALDETAERELYRALHALCPDTTVVSVGHRSSLVAVHDTHWAIDDRAAPGIVADAHRVLPLPRSTPDHANCPDRRLQPAPFARSAAPPLSAAEEGPSGRQRPRDDSGVDRERCLVSDVKA